MLPALGPSTGSSGHEGGAIEVANPTFSPVNVDALTVDFAAPSQPSHFDLWGGGQPGKLPLVLQPGQILVVSATGSFNFDTSDLLGEACYTTPASCPSCTSH